MLIPQTRVFRPNLPKHRPDSIPPPLIGSRVIALFVCPQPIHKEPRYRLTCPLRRVGEGLPHLVGFDDVNAVRALRRDPEVVAAWLERQITPAEIASWRKGKVEDWANETCGVASREVYSRLPETGGTEEPVILQKG